MLVLPLGMRVLEVGRMGEGEAWHVFFYTLVCFSEYQTMLLCSNILSLLLIISLLEKVTRCVCYIPSDRGRD